jgi:hypothetical protein
MPSSASIVAAATLNENIGMADFLHRFTEQSKIQFVSTIANAGGQL